MSLLSRMSASTATHPAVDLVDLLLRDPKRPGRRDLLGPPTTPAGEGAAATRLPAGPTGLGSAAATALLPERVVPAPGSVPAGVPAPCGGGARRGAVRIPSAPPGPRLPGGSGDRVEDLAEGRAAPHVEPRPRKGRQDLVLYCPPAVRDDPALGREVDRRLVEWAEEVGIYPGQLDKVRKAEFGRLMMLAHPETDDPERLLAAAKCGLSEWAVDDHYVDGEVEDARPELLGQRLAIAHSVIDQANLPLRYAPQLERVVRDDPVCVALRSAINNLSTMATASQVRRLRHELGIMFVAYNQEAVWQAQGQRPPVWEFLMHRHENSFVPCMVLIDAIAGYELPYGEFADPRVRRVFTLAGSATVIVNDLYSMAKEDPGDFSLPRLIAAEDDCSLTEAVERTVEIHDELMHTFEAESSALAATGSPELRRFLAGTWAWLGGSREWHSSSGRYHQAAAD
ncbi:family 2 encapsulin nanocompartment cargo protein terpene cyclase [Nocardiopsis sp. FIRDI 009]|uniref:family 2 encapsulin nanocompartment cargo protein terpene cyclase n=1 Tax=Nocardiopsis sp. FIRDI 009 TaxID=714197 RepID=UPI000E221A27|nr:family 2 encapsulin nanocompartment cargo protein terpene cyclase [Nocardiopsis sp. FIRDI 009]